MRRKQRQRRTSRQLKRPAGRSAAPTKNIGNAIAQGIITETTKELLEEAEADRTALRQQIDRAKVQAALVVKAEAVACWLDGFRRGDRTDPDFRRQVFGALVHSVFVYDDYLKIIFNVDSAGAAVVPYEAAQAATPSEAPPGSYLDTLGAPEKTATMVAVFFIIEDKSKHLLYRIR